MSDFNNPGEIFARPMAKENILIYLLLGCTFAAMIICIIYVGWIYAIVLATVFTTLLFSQKLLEWQTLLFIFVSTLLLIPANLYSLPSVLPFDLEIYRLAAAVILSLWVFALLGRLNVKLHSTTLDLAIGLFVGAVLVSLMVNLTSYVGDDFSAAIKAAVYLASLVLIFYFVVSTTKSRTQVDTVLKCIVIVTTIASISGIIERFTGYNLFRHLHEWIPLFQVNEALVGFEMTRDALRVAGPVVHPIAFSALLAMVVPFSWHYWQSAKSGHERIMFGSSFALIVVAIILTGSRTGFLGLVGASIVLFIANPEKRWLMMGAIIALMLGVHMVFPGSLGTLKTWLTPSYIEATEVGNRAGRYEDYPRIWSQFTKMPLFGLGYEMFRPKIYFYVDNQYLKFLVEIGLFGTLGFIYLISKVLKQLWQSARRTTGELRGLLIAIAASSLVFTICCATFDTFGFAQISYLFFVIVGLGMALIRIEGITEKAGDRIAAES